MKHLDVYGILTNRANNSVYISFGIPMLELRTVDAIRDNTRVIPTPANPRPGRGNFSESRSLDV